MRKTYMEELERKFDEASESDSVSVDTNTSERYFSKLVFFYCVSFTKPCIKKR